MQLLPSIEDGHVVLHLGGDLDADGAATVVRLIQQTKGDGAIDFSDIQSCEQGTLDTVTDAIRRCPYHLAVRGLSGTLQQ